MAKAGDEINDARIIADWTTHVLERVAVDVSGWLILYKRKDTGQFWEQSYPHSEMHSGGPPLLRCLGDKASDWKGQE